MWLDGVKQLVFIDCWNPSRRDRQVLYYKNGLSQGRHELKVTARGTKNPYSTGNRVYVDAVQFSAAESPTAIRSATVRRPRSGWSSATWVGPIISTPKVMLGGPPANSSAAPGSIADSVAGMWWITPAAKPIENTADAELYRHGVHGHEFRVNVTVGPGTYYTRLKFAAARGADTANQCFDIRINGRKAVDRLDVAAKAGGPNRALDLVFNGIEPRNGIIEVRFTGKMTAPSHGPRNGQAFVQALEVGLGDGGPVAVPLPPTPPSANFLE